MDERVLVVDIGLGRCVDGNVVFFVMMDKVWFGIESCLVDVNWTEICIWDWHAIVGVLVALEDL